MFAFKVTHGLSLVLFLPQAGWSTPPRTFRWTG